MQQGYSEGDSPGGKNFGSSLSAHTDDAVMPSEIERLADLSGYLKVRSRPEWFLAKVAWRGHAAADSHVCWCVSFRTS